MSDLGRSDLTVVFSSDALGGSELFNLEFLDIVREAEIRIHALVPGDGPLARALEPLAVNIATIPIPAALVSMSRFQPGIEPSRLPRRACALGSYLPRLARALGRSPGPVCSFGFRSQLAVAAALRPRRRGIWVVHEVVPTGAPARLWRAASRRAGRIVTYSLCAASQPALRDRGAEVRAVRFDLSRYCAIADVKRVRTIGLVGDLVEIKNHLLAVELARRLRAVGEDVSVLLVGRDVSSSVPRAREYAERLRQIAAKTPGVELVSTTPEGMPEIIGQIDVLLHLSSVPESFGRVCVEAMAAGRPVIAYDHGGVSELIDDARTGFLRPPGEPEAVFAALLAIVRDDKLCAEIGRSARAQATERFGQRPDARDTIGHALVEFATANR